LCNRRPSDKKSPAEITKPKASVESSEVKVELCAPKPMKKPMEEKVAEAPGRKIGNSAATSLGKIVDMPLITSTNLISVMREDAQKSLEGLKKTAAAAATTSSPTGPSSGLEQRRATSIARTPAVKKSEIEKPRIVAQPSAEQNAARNQKNLEMSNGVELSLSPIGSGGGRGDDTTNYSKVRELSLRVVLRFASDRGSSLAPLSEWRRESAALELALPLV
jgi:hypothetical protein